MSANIVTINATASGVTDEALFTPKKTCSFGFWNVCTLNDPAKASILVDDLVRLDIQCAVISECRWKHSGESVIYSSRGTDPYKIFYSGGDTHNRGVALLVKRKLAPNVSSFTPVSDRLATFEIKAQIPISVIAVYAPTNCSLSTAKDDFYADLQNCLNNVNYKHSCIVVGDFNAETGSDAAAWNGTLGRFGVGNRNDNGIRMLSFASSNGLICANSWFRHKPVHKLTFYSNDGKTRKQIDHILVSRNIRSAVNDVRVYPHTGLVSDHSLVVARIQLHLKVHRTLKRCPPLDLTALSSPITNQRYNVAVHNRFSTLLPTNDINRYWSSIKTTIATAVREVCPKKQRNRHPYISQDTLQLVERRRNETSRPLRTHLGRRIKRALKQDEVNWLAGHAQQMQRASDVGDMGTLFKTINTLSGGVRAPIPSAIKDATGNPISSGDQRSKRWAEHFENLYNRPEPQQLDPDLDDNLSVPSDLVSTLPPTLNEVITVVQNLKTSKSTGTCDIPAEALRSLTQPNLATIHNLILKIWDTRRVPQDFKDGIIVPIFKKGSRYDCANYRGITLLSIAGKILTSIIRSRLEPLYESTCREQQSGFRRGRGCIDQIFTLRRVLERRLRHGKPTVACFIDFAAAFDSVHRDSMWQVLRKCGVPDLFTDIIMDLYCDASSTVRIDSGQTGSFLVKSGVRQGCVMSPMMFNLALDWVMRKSILPNDGVQCSPMDTICDLAYADDIAILQPDAQSCQETLSRISAHAAALGLKIKPSKTKVIYANLPAPPLLTIDGEDIEVTDRFQYLGSTVCAQQVSSSMDISSRISKASQTFNRLRKWVFGRRDLSTPLKMKVYNAAVNSILLYSAETWAFTEADLQTLEVFQMSSLRYILGISMFQRVPNTEIRNRCSQPSVEQLIRKRRLRWAGHVARMPEGRICGSVWRHPRPEGWRCVPNAAKTTWDFLLAKDLAPYKRAYGTINWNNNYVNIISDLAADRNQWRRIVWGQATPENNAPGLQP